MKRAAKASVSTDFESEESFNGFETDEDAITLLHKRFKTNDDVFSVFSKQMKHKADRKPTRQPDPKVTNRNALMARENRRKHKEKLEMLEIQTERLSEKNSSLEAQLKYKDLIIKDLRRELMHMKSVIANKTQITQILSTLQLSGLKVNSPVSPPNSTREMSPSTESTVSASSSGYTSPSPTLTINATNDDKNNNGTADSNIDQLLQEAFDFPNLTFTDYEMNTNALATDDTWAFMGESNGIFPDLSTALFDDNEVATLTNTFIKKESISSEVSQSNLGTEHNYSEPGDADPGVCVHISNQKVSIEFCARCHTNAVNGKELDLAV